MTNETNANELLNTVNDTGIIIDGERKNNLFNINPGCDVNIDNLTLVNAYSNSDGATINNKGKLKLNTTFIKNSLIRGSKDENDDFKDINGGAISSTGDLIIDYCTFQDNKASSYSRGGSIYSTGKLNITNSICINSTADSGGAVYSSNMQEIIDLDNCFFMNNHVGYSENGESGGAIYSKNKKLNINWSDFINNSGVNGGAIDTKGTELNMDSDDFILNNVKGDGGAIRVIESPYTNIKTSDFTNNTAKNNGAGLYYSDGNQLNLNDSSFTENTAENDGGGISLKKGNLNLQKTSLTHNNAFGNGGAVYNYDSDILLDNLTMTFNIANNGAAIYTVGDHDRNVNIQYGLFNHNAALNNGGAVYADTRSEFIVQHGVFSDNLALNDGGGLYTKGNVEINNASYVNNTCRNNGAGVNLNGNINNIHDALFDENVANHDGGAIYNSGNNIELRDSLYYSNSASNDGGALFSKTQSTEFYHNKFENNQCEGYGGAVYAEKISTSDTKNVNEFINNRASKDGDDFITQEDKTRKANAGIIGYAISAFLLATIATIFTCGLAAIPSIPALTALIGAGIGVLSLGIEIGVMELIKYFNTEFDDYCKEHSGIMIVIEIAMQILGTLAGLGILKSMVIFGRGTLAKLPAKLQNDITVTEEDIRDVLGMQGLYDNFVPKKDIALEGNKVLINIPTTVKWYVSPFKESQIHAMFLKTLTYMVSINMGNTGQSKENAVYYILRWILFGYDKPSDLEWQIIPHKYVK